MQVNVQVTMSVNITGPALSSLLFEHCNSDGDRVRDSVVHLSLLKLLHFIALYLYYTSEVNF